MAWFYFALLGYFLYALVTVGNKFLLRQRATTKPVVFTFWVCLLSLFSFVLVPFGLNWPGWNWLAFDILAGFIYFLSLLTYYQALDINEASRVAPFAGGLNPIFVLLLAYFFLGETLSWQGLVAFILLVIGGFLISLERRRGGYREGLKGLWSIAASILFGAIYSVMLKHLFEYQSFITGFFWSRLGLVAGALVTLLWPVWRAQIFHSWRESSVKLNSLMVGVKILAGFGALFVSLAVALGSVSLVNALQGAQFAFLFLLVLLLAKKWPEVCPEKMSVAIIVQKSLAIILICAGLALVAL